MIVTYLTIMTLYSVSSLFIFHTDVVDSDPANDELYTRMMEQKMKCQENPRKNTKGLSARSQTPVYRSCQFCCCCILH